MHRNQAPESFPVVQKAVWIWERLSVLRQLSGKKSLKGGPEGREGLSKNQETKKNG